MLKRLRNKLIGPGDTPARFARRVLGVGLRTGLIFQAGIRGLGRLARLLPTQTLGPGIIHSYYAASFGDRACVVTDPQTLTYDEIDRLINRLVHSLRALGVDPGHKIVIMSPNSWQYLVAFFAAIRGGFSAVHASYRLTADELEYIVTHADARVVLFAPDCEDVARQVQRRRAVASTLWIATAPLSDDASDVLQLADILAGQPDTFPSGQLRLRGAHNVVYTSGTTGRPKGAVRKMSDMGLTEALSIVERLAYASGERHLVVCPLYHSGAQAFAMLHSGLGSALVLESKFDPEKTLRTLRDQAIDSVFLVPTMIRQILDLPAPILHRHRPHLRCLISGAAPFPHALRERAIRYFGNVVYDFYGTTENGWLTLVDSAQMQARPNTVGRAIAGAQIIIVDDAGRPLPFGEVGRIASLSHMVIDGYHQDAKATRESRVGGAHISGDLGYLDADGYLFLSGRSSDMIISGGVNTYPAEIEQVLAHHPDVRDVAVAGLPDETWGEIVAAFLVGPSPSDIPDLEAFCRTRLASFKVPRAWHFLEDLPRNPTGKVLKRQLREEYGAR
jgi:long-chain acyl-CoA synthetase